MEEKLLEEYNNNVEKRNEYQHKAWILERNSFESKFLVSSLLSFVAFALTITNLPKIVALNIIPLNVIPSFSIAFPIVVGTSIRILVDKIQKIKKEKKSFSKAKSQSEVLKEQLQYEIEKEKIDNYRSVIKRIFDNDIENIQRGLNNTNDKEKLKKEIETLESNLENSKKKLAIATTRKKLNDYFWRIRESRLNRIANILMVGGIGTGISMFCTLFFLESLKSINLVIDLSLIQTFSPAIIFGIIGTGYGIKRNADRMKVFKVLNEPLGEDALPLKGKTYEEEKILSSTVENEMYQTYSLMKTLETKKQQLENIELQKETPSEENQNIICEAKEKAIIDLYAKQIGISEEEAELIYRHSKLKNIIRDTKNGLYLESPYFILERYSEYMTPINKSILDEDLQCPKITQEAIDFIKRHPELYVNCPVLYQMGRIYKDGEFEKRSDEVLSRKLP